MYLRSLQHGSGVRSDGCRHGMEEQASWSALYSAHTLPQISKLELAIILQCARLLPVATMVFLYSALPHSRSTDTLSPLPNMKTEIRPFMRVLHNQGARGCRRLGREEFRCRAGKKAHTGTESNRDECMMVTEFDVCERRVLRFWSLRGVQSMWRFEWS